MIFLSRVPFHVKIRSFDERFPVLSSKPPSFGRRKDSALCITHNERKRYLGRIPRDSQPVTDSSPTPAVTRSPSIDEVWRHRSFVLPVPPQDAVVQKVQETSPAFSTTCIFGDPRPYRRRTSRLRCDTGRLPRRCASLDFLATYGADLAAVAGINNGGGSRITLLDRKSVDEQVRPSSTSTRTPEHENDAASECASHCSC